MTQLPTKPPLYLTAFAAILASATAFAGPFVTQETIVTDGISYSLQKYIPKARPIDGCPWRQAAMVVAKPAIGSRKTVSGQGCWVEGTAGDITVWIANQNGADFTASLTRPGADNRPQAIMTNIERWDASCRNTDKPAETRVVACQNRDHALAFVERDGWCWFDKGPSQTEKRWARCPAK